MAKNPVQFQLITGSGRQAAQHPVFKWVKTLHQSYEDHNWMFGMALM